MAKSTSTKKHIEIELEYAETQLATWKKFLDDNPIDGITERIVIINDKEVIASNIESQIKAIRDILKDYLSLLSEVERLRAEEEKKKVAVRGDREVSYRAKKLL